MTMQFIVSTHSVLLYLALDSDWNVTAQKVLNTGYHFGIGIRRVSGQRSMMSRTTPDRAAREWLGRDVCVRNSL